MEKIWFTMKGDVKTFQKLSAEEVDKLEDDDFIQYSDDLEAHKTELYKALENDKASKDELDKLKTEIEELKNGQISMMSKAMKELSLKVSEMKENGINEDSETFKDGLKKAFDEHVKTFEGLGSGDSATMTFKAEQTYGDITTGLDFAQFKPGITDIPVRKAVFRTLFGTIPLSTESLKYTEQETVVRDTQNVAKCAEVTSNTKETLIVRNIDTKVIQDTIDFCRTFISDFPFMESRINKLLNESIALKADQQVLLGTGLLEETFSINSVSSDFDAANIVCVLTAAIQAPNLVDLISGMATQVFELGQQDAYVPNIAIVNNCDWFKDVASLKDLNNNYLDVRVVVQSGQTFIVTLAGMLRIVTSPLVPQNTCYVLDSTKGDIVDRMEVQVDVSFENKDNFVKHIGTLLGWERFNFLVENNNKNAFMRCLDIDAAIIAITK